MRKAVVTLCVGERFGELAKITHPFQRAYASKIEADHVVISERKFKTEVICYEKLQIKELLQTYDRILYLDTDIIVKPNCPDLFSLIPLGWFGAFSEGAWLDRTGAIEIGCRQFIYQHSILKKWEKRYFNAGVMVVDKSHRHVFGKPDVFHNNFEDQTWMNIQVATKARNFVDIGPHFNRMSHLSWGERMESFIIHYAGGMFADAKADGELLNA